MHGEVELQAIFNHKINNKFISQVINKITQHTLYNHHNNMIYLKPKPHQIDPMEGICSVG